ncbi:hypothetical protein ACOQFL_19645 [Actinopolyspora sp. H202]|uniref:hypothetical protein n=1 Tax=Actinopolyspora sp. H202 TaxID=1500456 RepID=UPI003EE69CE6
MNKKSEEESIREWLQGQGYPLEMKVAYIFEQLSHTIGQSCRYRDRDSSLLRETDVVAGWGGLKRGGPVSLNIVLECKSNSSPSVVFKSYDLDSPEENFFTDDEKIATITGYPGVSPVDADLDFELSLAVLDQENRLLSGPSMAGYAVTQGLRTGNAKDWSYDSARQALAAAVGMATEEKTRRIKDKASFYVPVVVTSGSIYDCSLSSDGDLQLRKVKRSCVEVNTGVLYERYLVHIVNEDHVEDFANECSRTGEAIAEIESPLLGG